MSGCRSAMPPACWERSREAWEPRTCCWLQADSQSLTTARVVCETDARCFFFSLSLSPCCCWQVNNNNNNINTSTCAPKNKSCVAVTIADRWVCLFVCLHFAGCSEIIVVVLVWCKTPLGGRLWSGVLFWGHSTHVGCLRCVQEFFKLAEKLQRRWKKEQTSRKKFPG